MISIKFKIVIFLIFSTIKSTLAAGYAPSGSPSSPELIPSNNENGLEGSSADPPIPIIKMDAKFNEDGSYNYEYETGNGIQVQESGYTKNAGVEGQEIHVKEGSFSYTSPEGQTIVLTYIADEKGFQPMGDHLPTPPPVPPEIQAVIDKIAAGGGCDGNEVGENPGGGNGEPGTNGGYVY